MKYYTSSRYTGKSAQKRMLRAVLIAALAVGILVGWAVLGNLFKDRLQRAADLLALQPEDYALSPAKPETTEYTKPSKKRASTVSGICMPLSAAVFSDTKAIGSALDEAVGSFAGISVTAADENGLHFQLDGIQAPAGALEESVLTDTVSLASARGLPVSAVVHTSGSAATDGDILRKLAGCGVTETVLLGLTGETLDSAYTYTLLLYLEHLRTAAPDMAVGIALSPSLFRSAASADHLDSLFSYFDFLLLDLTSEESLADAKKTCAALYGSMTYYNLSVLLQDSTAQNTSPDEWEKAGLGNVRFLTKE